MAAAAANDVCNEFEKDCSFATLILLSWIECINDSNDEYEFALFDLGINWRDVSIVNAATKEAPSQAIVSEVPKRFIPRALLHHVLGKCEQSETSLVSTSVAESRKSGPVTNVNPISLLTGANDTFSGANDTIQVLNDIIEDCIANEENDIYAKLLQHLEYGMKEQVANNKEGKKKLEKTNGERLRLVDVISDTFAAPSDNTKLLANHPLKKILPQVARKEDAKGSLDANDLELTWSDGLPSFLKCNALLRTATRLTLSFMVGNHRAMKAFINLSGLCPTGDFRSNEAWVLPQSTRGTHVAQSDTDRNFVLKQIRCQFLTSKRESDWPAVVSFAREQSKKHAEVADTLNTAASVAAQAPGLAMWNSFTAIAINVRPKARTFMEKIVQELQTRTMSRNYSEFMKEMDDNTTRKKLIDTIAKAKGVDPSHPQLLEAKSSLDNRLNRTTSATAPGGPTGTSTNPAVAPIAPATPKTPTAPATSAAAPVHAAAPVADASPRKTRSKCPSRLQSTLELVKKSNSAMEESVAVVLGLASLIHAFALTKAHANAMVRYFIMLHHGFRRECCPPQIRLVGDSESQNSWEDGKTLPSPTGGSSKEESIYASEDDDDYDDDEKPVRIIQDFDEEQDEQDASSEEGSEHQEKVRDIAGFPTILQIPRREEGRSTMTHFLQDTINDVLELREMLSTHMADHLMTFVRFLMTTEESKKDGKLFRYSNVDSFTMGKCVMHPSTNQSPLMIHGVDIPSEYIATEAEAAVSPLADPNTPNAVGDLPAGASSTPPSSTTVKKVDSDSTAPRSTAVNQDNVGPISTRTRSGGNLSIDTGDSRYLTKCVNVLVTMELPLDILSFLETVGLDDPKLKSSLGNILELAPLTKVKSSMTIRFLLLVVLILKDDDLTIQLDLVQAKVLFLDLARFILRLRASKKIEHQEESDEFKKYKENLHEGDPSKFPLLVNLYGVSFQSLLRSLEDIPENEGQRTRVEQHLGSFSKAPMFGKRSRVSRELFPDNKKKKKKNSDGKEKNGDGEEKNGDKKKKEKVGDTSEVESDHETTNEGAGDDDDSTQDSKKKDSTTKASKRRTDNNFISMFGKSRSLLSAATSISQFPPHLYDEKGAVERWQSEIEKKSQAATRGWNESRISNDCSDTSYTPLLDKEVCCHVSVGGKEVPDPEVPDPVLRARAAMSFFSCKNCAAMYLVATGGEYLATKMQTVTTTIEKDLTTACNVRPSSEHDEMRERLLHFLYTCGLYHPGIDSFLLGICLASSGEAKLPCGNYLGTPGHLSPVASMPLNPQRNKSSHDLWRIFCRCPLPWEESGQLAILAKQTYNNEDIVLVNSLMGLDVNITTMIPASHRDIVLRDLWQLMKGFPVEPYHWFLSRFLTRLYGNRSKRVKDENPFMMLQSSLNLQSLRESVKTTFKQGGIVDLECKVTERSLVVLRQNGNENGVSAPTAATKSKEDPKEVSKVPTAATKSKDDPKAAVTKPKEDPTAAVTKPSTPVSKRRKPAPKTTERSKKGSDEDPNAVVTKPTRVSKSRKPVPSTTERSKNGEIKKTQSISRSRNRDQAKEGDRKREQGQQSGSKSGSKSVSTTKRRRTKPMSIIESVRNENSKTPGSADPKLM